VRTGNSKGILPGAADSGNVDVRGGSWAQWEQAVTWLLGRSYGSMPIYAFKFPSICS